LNIIPTNYFGTDLLAAPIVGILASIVYCVMAYFYIKFIMKNSEKNFDLSEFDNIASVDLNEDELEKIAPNAVLSIIPIITALVLINLLKLDIVIGLIIASIVGMVLFNTAMKDKFKTVNDGIVNGIMPLVYVSVVVGVARTVEAAPFFEVMKDVLLNSNIPGLLKVVSVTSVFSAMTGSSSGSMTMILELFGGDFLAWGYHPELLHRLISTSSLGFDSLPWNSVVVVFFSLSGVSYAKGYKHVFMTTVVMSLIAAGFIMLISPIFY